MCDGKGTCGNMIDGTKKHKLNVSKDVHTIGEKKEKGGNFNNETKQLDRYRIPEDLIFSLFQE